MSMTWHFASLAGAPYPRQTDRTILSADPSLAGLITPDGLESCAERLTGINTSGHWSESVATFGIDALQPLAESRGNLRS